ncbi:MAG: Gfo/Idh/MocA family oxidoreductase [Methanomicrobia archaeon]|nr:Gfo/Idh/MocA family oxidoreductase [Methanomicrobia archaeon]
MRITKANQPITICVVGAGHRADQYLEAMQKFYQGKFHVTSIFEPSPVRQAYFKDKYQVDTIYAGGYEDFLKIDERLTDIVIIGTNDDMHYLPAKHALLKGYDILLEKPICQRLEEVLELKDLQKDDQFVAVCHVLRHSPFFVKIKEIIDSGVIGKVVNIQHNENIGFFHFAHSYVRGNWRNNEVAAPLIVAKSCHDLDILLHLTGKHCKRISSFGSLSFFNHEHYDEKTMAKRCTVCPREPDCPFSAVKIYGLGIFEWMPFDTQNRDNLYRQLNASPYGRCVFASDNDVVDHQVTIIEFDDGLTATFNLSAFTSRVTRTLKIMGEYGEIRADTDVKDIEVKVWAKDTEKVRVETKLIGGHDGADEGMIINLMEAYLHGRPFESTLKDSIESHVMAFKAEESRINDGKVQEIAPLMAK